MRSFSFVLVCLLSACGAAVPPPPVACSPSTCTRGCCLADGGCEEGFGHCGAPGTQCVRCNLQSFCVTDRDTGARRCSLSQCGCNTGCCDEYLYPDAGRPTFQCLPGNTATACGSNGNSCRQCSGSCVSGACQ